MRLPTCPLVAYVIVLVAATATITTNGGVHCLQLDDLYQYMKNPFLLHFSLDGHPETKVLQRDLDDFFYLNEYNDRPVGITQTSSSSSTSGSSSSPSSSSSSQSQNDTESQSVNAVSYIIRTLHAKYKVCIRGLSSFSSTFYDLPGEKELASSPRMNQTLCGKQLDYMIATANNDNTHISRGANVNLMRILDTFGRPGVSTFESQLTWIGNYQQCINSKLFIPAQPADINNYHHDDSSSAVPMHYCVGHFRYPEWPNSTFYERNLVMKVALCLPDTCDSFSYDYHKQKLIQLALSNIGPRQAGFYMSSLYCLPHRESKLLASDNNPLYVSFWVFSFIWFVVVVVCSVYHFFLIIQNNTRIKEEKKEELRCKLAQLVSQRSDLSSNADPSELKLLNETMSAQYLKMRVKQVREIKQLRSLTESEHVPLLVGIFSIIGNCRKLFMIEEPASGAVVNGDKSKTAEKGGESQPRGDNRIVVLDGLKGIAITIVVFGHCTLEVILCTFTTVEVKGNFNFAYSEYFFIAPFMMLNCFLIITGLLTSLLIFKQGKRFVESPINWLLITIVRYLRIMPLLLYAIWMSKANYRKIGHGPLWDYGTAIMSHNNICENESWWLSVFLLNNLRQMNFQCVGPAWYLATDFQLYFMTAPFVILLSKNQRLGYLACSLVCLVGLATGIVTLMWGTLDKLIYLLKPPYNAALFEEVHYYYTLPINRSGPYFMGIIAGHLIHRMNRGKLTLESSYVWLNSWPMNTILAKDGNSTPTNQQETRKTTTTTATTAGNLTGVTASQEEKSGLKQLFIGTFKTHSVLIALLMTFFSFGSLPNYILINVFDCQGSWDSPMERLFLASLVTLVTYFFCLLVTIAMFFGAIGYDKTYYYSLIKFKLWRPIARASLSILVFHYFIMKAVTTNNVSSFESSSFKTLITSLFGTGLICIMVSMTMCLIFEYPLTNTIEHLLKTYIYKRTTINKNKQDQLEFKHNRTIEQDDDNNNNFVKQTKLGSQVTSDEAV